VNPLLRAERLRFTSKRSKHLGLASHLHAQHRPHPLRSQSPLRPSPSLSRRAPPLTTPSHPSCFPAFLIKSVLLRSPTLRYPRPLHPAPATEPIPQIPYDLYAPYDLSLPIRSMMHLSVPYPNSLDIPIQTRLDFPMRKPPNHNPSPPTPKHPLPGKNESPR
jgi:hypothetical protein